ncbi:hypothetical protein ONE63_009476 [Megalurothrips usitatus]|uniref:Ferritin n=1 Tax=Megalurothrips usitatus TaxID=439358 RepID=A0AAV7XPH0_9NEOP|nr:hypothetical protein ONE63_009476 [Megalurothrips usitatus]
MRVLCAFVAVAVLVGVASAEANNYCFDDVSSKCSARASGEEAAIPNCNAKYGAVEKVSEEISDYVNKHISRSFQYLLMSTHFGSYQANRPGFEKLYRVLSDEAWAASFDLIKHLTKRGGKMNFSYHQKENLADSGEAKKEVYELYELQSLARALDIQKSLAGQAFHIHHSVSGKDSKHHDPELSQFFEERFIEKHADTIRNLAGHTSDLKNLLLTSDSSLNVFLFDDYLHKKLSG